MRRDTEQLLEGAYSYFAKTFGKNKFLTLIRNVLISTAVLKTFGKYKEAARLFAKASGVVSESPLVGPLFLEQTAACFLRISSPKPFFRKFCFLEAFLWFSLAFHSARIVTHIFVSLCNFFIQDIFHFFPLIEFLLIM